LLALRLHEASLRGPFSLPDAAARIEESTA
jgi:hypothetical protein